MRNLVRVKHLKSASIDFKCGQHRHLSAGSCLFNLRDFTIREHFPNIQKLQTQYYNIKIREDSFKNFVSDELIEECNMDASSFYFQGYEKRFVVTMDIGILKKHGLISQQSTKMNLADRFLSYLEPFPFDKEVFSSSTSELTHSITIKDIRNAVEKQYLAWKFNVDLQQVEEILLKLQSSLFTCRSLRNLRRNTSILDMIPSVKIDCLSKKIYILNQHPFSIPMVLNFQEVVSCLSWDVFSSCGFRTLQRSFNHIYFIFAILQSKGFTNKQIQEAIPYLYLGLDTFLNRMNVMLSHPALAPHQKHDQFLHLLEYQTLYLLNFKSLNFLPLENLRVAIDMIHSRMKLKRVQRITIKSIKYHTSNYFSVKEDHLNLIKRHPKYSAITEKQLSATLRFLKGNGFSSGEVLESIIIILYPKRVIAKTLRKIKEEEEVLKKAGFVNGCVPEETNFFKPGTKSKNKTLQLCLYYIEKQFNFSWDGVLNF